VQRQPLNALDEGQQKSLEHAIDPAIALGRNGGEAPEAKGPVVVVEPSNKGMVGMLAIAQISR